MIKPQTTIHSPPDDDDEHIAKIAAAVAASLDHHDLSRLAARRFRRDPLVIVLLTMLALSLIIHAVTFSWLFSVRRMVYAQLDLFAERVLEAKDERLSYTLPIDQHIPLSATVAISHSFRFPINTSVDIDQTLRIPVNSPFGSFELPIPINTTIPVSTVVPINFNEQIPLSTTVHVDTIIPIAIDLNAPQFADYLDRLYKALIELRDQL